MINRTEESGLNFLVVPSRTFAATALIGTGNVGSPYANVPPQTEAALRQSKWQREFFPSTVSGKVRVAWHPYTTVSGLGPNTAQNNARVFQRIWNLNRWTPISWVRNAPNPLVTFGPYIIPNEAATNGNPPADVYPIKAVLTMYCQFKGQV